MLTQYYTPLRVSEILERKIGDFDITQEKITIHLARKKKRGKEKNEDIPISIRREWLAVEEIVEWLEGEEWRTDDNLKPWNFSYWTARNIVKEVFPEAYPHFFRFAFVTAECNYPDTTIGDLTSKTGLSLVTLNKYLKKSERVQDAYDRKRTDRFRKMGAI